MNRSFIRLSPENFSSFKGVLKLDKSKSIANRILILQALSQHAFEIGDSGNADDVKLMLAALNSKNEKINCGLAGTVARFLTAAFSVLPGSRVLDGDPPLRKRPIKPLIDALQQLGANISHIDLDGHLPIKIEGKELDGGEVYINQNISSQFISALMMIGPFVKNGLTIRREGERKSDSYVELTAQLMRDLSLKLEILDDRISIYPSNVSIKHYEIESDWSGAVYWMAFVCLIPHAKIVLKGLFKNSMQGDKALLEVLKPVGLTYRWEGEELILSNSARKIDSFECDCTSFPDQAQTLAFLCASLGVPCKLLGLETLKHKETNRIQALKQELEKMGIVCYSNDAELAFTKKIKEEELIIDTYQDHRMAMSATLLGVNHKVTINEPYVVSKSYPNFWNDLTFFTT